MRNKKTIVALSIICVFLFSQFSVLGATQSCTKTVFTPLSQSPLTIPSTPGNVNDDPTLINKEQFIDLDLPYSGDSNIISACIQKNNNARLLYFDLTSGSLTLSMSSGVSDPVNSNDPASIRGICTLSPSGNELFFIGGGPKILGYDRIYPFSVTTLGEPILSRLQESGTNDFFTPPDLATSLKVTPNGKYLVYLQADTYNNNLAAIQSVEIKSTMNLEEAFIGQDLAKVASAGTYFEFADNQSPYNEYAFGSFSNLEQGKAGSGDSIAIFKTNQITGINKILGEFKKGNNNYPLPALFNTSVFGGFSGFKFLEKDSGLYLFISYYDVDPNGGFPGFSYITKLALFKVNTGANPVTLVQIGSPISTIFKTAPCDGNNYHGISGPLSVSENTVYIADGNLDTFSKNENYFAAYSINWDLVSQGDSNTQVMRLSSLPIKTTTISGERNTDLIVPVGNNFAYIASASTLEPANAKVFSYLIKQSEVSCSTLDNSLSKALCTEEVSVTPDNTQMTEEPPTTTPPTPTAVSSSSSSGAVQYIPIVVFPSQPSTTGGPSRPPEFGGKPANTPGTGGKPKPSQPTTTTTTTTTQLPKPTLPVIELIPTESGTVSSETSLNIDINSLDLRGEDQNIVSPNIPYILFSTVSLESPVIETVTPDSYTGSSSSGITPTPVQASSSGVVVSAPVPVISSSSSSSSGIIPVSGVAPPVQTCCNCENGQLTCQANIVPTCANGKVKCVGTIIACCSGDIVHEVCNGDDPTIACFNSLSKVSTLLKQKPQETVKQNKPAIPISTIRGAIKAGAGGYVISLKKGIVLKNKDVKNIIHIVIDNSRKITVIPSATIIASPTKLLAKLAFPDTLPSGDVTLVTLINRGGGKKEVIAKGPIQLFDSYNFQNIGDEIISVNNTPVVKKIQGKVTGTSNRGGKMVRLTFIGKNFAARTIKINDQLFTAEPYKSNTFLSFSDESDIEILRTRVLGKGRTMLVTLRYTGTNDISTRSFTISTPKGQFYSNKLGVKLFSKDYTRSTTVEPDSTNTGIIINEKDKKDERKE